jgi:hypothetical protein
MRRLALAIGVVGLIVAAVAWGIPYLTLDRDYVAVTPQPDPLFQQTTIPLRGGQTACMDRAVVDPRSEQARLRVGTYGRAAVPLELVVRGAGYHVTAPIAATYADSQLLKVPVTPPARAVEATICVRNVGQRGVGLYASGDRTNSRSAVRVDGKPVPLDFTIAFFERRPVSILHRLPDSLQRASTFRGVVSPVVLWPLLILFAVGVPLAVLAAFAGSLPGRARDER